MKWIVVAALFSIVAVLVWASMIYAADKGLGCTKDWHFMNDEELNFNQEGT